MLSLTVSLGLAGFMPNVCVDRESRPDNWCFHPDIAIAPAGTGVYVAYEVDSLAGYVTVRSDVRFQKSTDAGKTWLPHGLLLRCGELFASTPDVTTDHAGNIYVVFTEQPSSSEGHLFSMRSNDSGSSWSAPVKIDDNVAAVAVGWSRVAADSAGNLFVAWNYFRTGISHIWSSVSTDRGTTWGPNVRVDNDTVSDDHCHPDVFVQPGTNDYLVVLTAPFWVSEHYMNSHSVLYRSTDCGKT